MIDEDRIHENVILVTDKVITVALFAHSHRSMEMFENNQTGVFYALFRPTTRLREDIKRYYDQELTLDTKWLKEGLDELEHHIIDQKCSIMNELESLTPAR
jgi:hypothetical protein